MRAICQGLQIVWFKRDLRLHDHEALHVASSEGPVLVIVLIETALWRASGLAAQHHEFALECYQDLHRELASLGTGLNLMLCEQAKDALAWLHQHIGIACIHSHMETGDGSSYARDRQLLAWCRQAGIPWREYRQFGVVRGLRERKAWASQWERLMRQSRFEPDPVRAGPALREGRAMLNNALPGARDQPLLRFDQPVPHDSLLLIHLPSGKFEHAAAIQSLDLPSSQALGLSPLRPPNRQCGGRQAAQAYLTSFLQTRSAFYRGGISSPLRAPEACSRLSVYLSFGCISLREVVQQSRCRLETIGDRSDRQYKGLEGFLSRLHWHCHFIQKLETEPAIECSNMHRGYDGLRESEFDQARFEALKAAQTGWPMVDACVRMLEDCGWLNFRMRAMLVSVASYPLWLHWREVGLWLARHFLDFEAGIHWSQMQMQSGTTGINTTRVYNPIKQAIEHDPQGIFVRRWLPALRSLPDQYIFEPWLAPLSLRDSRTDPIVEPIVDLARATREAKAKLYALRAKAAVIAESKSVVRKHASAMRSQERYLPSSKRQVDGGQGQGRKAPETATLATQMSFDFEETGKVQR